MGTGHEYLAKIHEALREFEEAIVAREGWKPLESKVMRGQNVDRARQRVIDAVVAIVTKERMDRQ